VESKPRDTLAATVNGYRLSTRTVYLSLGRGESHDMRVHAKPTFDCRYLSVNCKYYCTYSILLLIVLGDSPSMAHV